MEKNKVLIKIITLLLSLFVLTGCGRKEVTFDTTKEVTTAYTSEKLDVSDLPPITGMCGDEQYVYIAASPLRTDEKQKIYPEIYRIDKNNEVKQLSLPFEKEGTVYALSNISSSNEKSTFALLWRYQDQDGTAAYQIMICDEEGNVDQTISLQEISEELEAGVFGLQAFDGGFYIADANSVLSIDQNGKKKEDVCQGMILGFTGTENGIACLRLSESGMSVYDLNEKKIIYLLEDREENGDMRALPSDHTLLLCANKLWHVENGTAALVFALGDIGMNSEMVQTVCELPDGTLLLAARDGLDMNANQWIYICRVAGKNENTEGLKKTELVLGGGSISRECKLAVAAYNMQQDTVQITIKEYGTDEAGVKQLSMALTDGEIDLLFSSHLQDMEQYQGSLEDLSGVYENIAMTKPVREALTEAGSRYVIPGFRMRTFYKRGDNGKLYLYGGKEEVCDSFLYADVKGILDEENKKVDTNLLKEYIKTVEEMPEAEENTSLPELLKSDKPICGVTEISEPNDYMGIYLMGEQAVDYTGFEQKSSGQYVNEIVPMGVYGIVHGSKQEEECADFLYYLTGEEYQIKNAYPDYFPVNEKAQQRIWDIVSATKETTLSDGTQVNPYRCEVAYNDYEVVVEALDQEQLHSIKAWLDMPCVLYPQKKKYVELIEEEVIKYLEKQQSLSDTLEYVDKRVAIVLAE